MLVMDCSRFPTEDLIIIAGHIEGPRMRVKYPVLDFACREKQGVSLAICVALNVRSFNIPRLFTLYVFNPFMVILKKPWAYAIGISDPRFSAPHLPHGDLP